METPSSTRRVTRSQTLAAANSNNNNILMSKKVEECDKNVTTKSRQRGGEKQQDRSALIDISNNSPIVGLAMGSLETPSSRKVNGKAKYGTPGSGEALLRGQVKTLLQKVEEEAELSKISLETRPFLHLHGIVRSPMGLLAPTPANTPQVLNLSANGLASVSPSPVEDKLVISQMVIDIFDGKKQEGLESEKDLVTRSLLFDFSEKSEECDSSDCSSVVTYLGGGGGESEESKEKISTDDDDDASIWSIQVNASSTRDDEEEDEEEGLEGVEEERDDDYGYQEEEDEYDELCEGISKMNVNGGRTMAKFAGKHTRFVHNSDDELEGQEECVGESEVASAASSSNALQLKGLPTPKGKHIRFQNESDED